MRVVSIHVAKAGGTSIRATLSKAFGAGLMQDYRDDPADPLSARNVDPARHFGEAGFVPNGVTCVHGHLHPNKYRYRPDDILFTILREPVDNIISIYCFWKQLKEGGALHAYFLRNNLDLFEMARLPILRWLLSRTYFEDFDMGRFNFIGRHEARREAISLLASAAGVDLDTNIRINETAPTPERDELVSSASTRQRLTNILIDDVRFYERHAR